MGPQIAASRHAAAAEGVQPGIRMGSTRGMLFSDLKWRPELRKVSLGDRSDQTAPSSVVTSDVARRRR